MSYSMWHEQSPDAWKLDSIRQAEDLTSGECAGAAGYLNRRANAQLAAGRDPATVRAERAELLTILDIPDDPAPTPYRVVLARVAA